MPNLSQILSEIKDSIRTVPDWPIEGVRFRDITTLCQDPRIFRLVNRVFYERYSSKCITKVIGIDARGFIFGGVLAEKLGVGFVPIRKKGKLPFDTFDQKYTLEYGEATLSIHKDALNRDDQVVIIDDLLATGGTIGAALNLVDEFQCHVVECGFIVELPFLEGRDYLDENAMFAMCEFGDEE